MTPGRLAPAPDRDREIVVVSGLPRSGTSLMMQILSRAGWPLLHDEARPADASNPRGYLELAAVKGSLQDVGWIERAPGRAVKVIHALLPALPRDRRYRVLLMRRRISEVVASQDAMLARLGQPLPSLDRARVEAVFARQLQATRQLLADEPCFEWLEVDHASLLRAPEEEIARLAPFVGIDLARDGMKNALATCVEPRLYRARSVGAAAPRPTD